MTCEDVRATLTAARDDPSFARSERDAVKVAEVHVERCRSCAVWLDRAARVDRLLGVSVASAPADHLDRAIDLWEETFHGARAGEPKARLLARFGLVVAAAAVVQLVAYNLATSVRVPETYHVAVELAVFQLTLAAVFLATAWDCRTQGRVGFVLLATILLSAAAVYHLASGSVPLSAELVHLPLMVGLVLMLVIARSMPSPGTGVPPSGRHDLSGESAAA